MDSSLEYVRQQCIEFKRIEKVWKKNTPKGKKYEGYKFEFFKETDKDGFTGMGYKVRPVYKKIKKHGGVKYERF